MGCLNLSRGPSIKQFVKSIRERSPRSAYINREVTSVRAHGESGTNPRVNELLGRYIDPRIHDLATMAFSIERVAFNPVPAGDGPKKWARSYWRCIISHWETLQEFLEVADTINQLATAFVAVPDAEYHWGIMYTRALYLSHGTKYMHCAPPKAPDVPLMNWSFMDLIRLGMLVSSDRNLPGTSPTDNEGNPIDPDFFARVQSSFWIEELKARTTNLKDLYRSGQLPRNDEIRHMINWLLDQSPLVDTVPFQRLVKWQRLSMTAHKAGISDPRTMKGLFRVLREDNFCYLGVQGTAAMLPRHGDSYELKYLFQLSSINSQITIFLHQLDCDSQLAWCDGWFQKYPVAGPIDQASLDIKYLCHNEEDPGWQEAILWRGHETETIARAIKLDEAEIDFLWGTDSEFSFDTELLDTFDWLISTVGSHYDAQDMRAMLGYC